MDSSIMEIDDNGNNKIQQQNGESLSEIKATSNNVVNAKQDNETKTEMQLLIEQIKPSSYGQKRNYSSIDISAEKWLMAYDAASMAKLENPPSLADGISQELEKEIRYLGCELIQSGAILLKLNQTAAATGQIIFQRFYYQKSFVRYNFQHTLMACLLLASKIEEEPRKPRDVVNVYNRLKQLHQHRRRLNSISNKNGIGQQQQQQQRPTKFEHLPLGGTEYLRTKNEVIKAERRILNTLGFVVHVHHPHKLIYIYLFILGLLRKKDDPNASAEEIVKSSELLQRAWSYMNDGLRTDMFLRYPPETIACACIQLAVKTVDQPIVLPKDPFPWFELFDASDRDVRVISEMLLNLYNRKKAPSMEWILMQLEKQQQKLADEEKAKELAEKAKQNKELAEKKEAILKRISEHSAAVKGKGEEALRSVKSASGIEKMKSTANKNEPIKNDRLSGNGRMDNSRERDKSPRKERKEEKRRRSRSRDRDRSGKDSRQRDRDERDKYPKRSDSRDRDYKNRRKEQRRTKSRSPIAAETKQRDKKLDRRQQQK